MAYQDDFKKFLSGLAPKNMTRFGATPSNTLLEMEKLGLLRPNTLEDAEKSSNMTGLLNLGLNYFAQPKNQGHGSILPYLAKAAIPAMSAAQGRYDKVASNSLQNIQLKKMKEEMDDKILRDKYNATYGTPNKTIGQQVGVQNISSRPRVDNNENINSLLMGQNNLGMQTQSPNYDLQKTPLMEDKKVFDQNQWLEGAVANKVLNPIDLIKLNATNANKANYKMLSKEDIKSGVYGDPALFDPSKTYQVNTASGQINKFDEDKSGDLETNEFGRLAFTMFGKKDVNTLTQEEVKNVNTRMEDVADRRARSEGGLEQLDSAAKNQVQVALKDLFSRKSRLYDINNLFQEKFLTYGTQAQVQVLSVLEKMSPNLLNDEQRQLLAESADFKASAFAEINEYIRSITGAAMSELEAERIMKATADPDMSPSQYKSVMKKLTKSIEIAEARLLYLNKNGFKSIEDVGLSEFEGIMNDRGIELNEQYSKSSAFNPNYVDIKDLTSEQQKRIDSAVFDTMRKEFGLN